MTALRDLTFSREPPWGTSNYGAAMKSVVWIDGRLTGPDEASLAVDDHGITTGDGAFETLLAVNNPRRTAFAIGRHLTRLHRSCDVLGIELQHSDDTIRAAIDSCAAAAPDAGLVRINVTSGRGPLAILCLDSFPAVQRQCVRRMKQRRRREH